MIGAEGPDLHPVPTVARQRVSIPMATGVDSLNATACAVALYEPVDGQSAAAPSKPG